MSGFYTSGGIGQCVADCDTCSNHSGAVWRCSLPGVTSVRARSAPCPSVRRGRRISRSSAPTGFGRSGRRLPRAPKRAWRLAFPTQESIPMPAAESWAGRILASAASRGTSAATSGCKTTVSLGARHSAGTDMAVLTPLAASRLELRCLLAVVVATCSSCGCGGVSCGSILSLGCAPGLICVGLRDGACRQECVRVCAAPCSPGTCAAGCSCTSDANGTSFCGKWNMTTLSDGGSVPTYQDECF